MMRLTFEVVGPAPELRRPLVRERARQAPLLVAALTAHTPQHVHRAHQPVFVRLVNLHAAAGGQ